MRRENRHKTPERNPNSSKSIRERKRKQNTQNSNTFVEGVTPERPTRKQSVSLAFSKSVEKSKRNNSRHYLSKSKYSDEVMEEYYYTPSKENDDIQYLVHPRFNKKFSSKKEEEGIRPFVEAAKKLVARGLISEASKVLETGLLINSKSSTINYFLAMCYLMSDDYANAIRLFKEQLVAHPKKNLYILLAVCYKKLNEYESALELLDNCLEKDPKFYDGFVERGRLYMKLRKFDKANHDFEQAILINEHKLIAYILKGDCLRKNNKFQLAIKMYKKGEKIQKSNSLTLRKIFCSIDLGEFQEAMFELNKVLAEHPKNGEFLFAKGLYYKKTHQYLSAYDYFNMSLSNNTSKHLSSRCLYEMGKIKIIKKDYFKAIDLLSTFPDSQISGNKEIERLKKICSGVICLIKEENEKGLKILNSIPKEYGITQSLSTLFYSCKAYGYMQLGQIEEARINLLKLERHETLSPCDLYNKYICEGILSWRERKCQQSLAYFSKSSKIIANKIEPFYYQALTLIQFIVSSKSEEKKKQYLQNALKMIKRQDGPSKKQTDLILIRGILEFYAKNYKNSDQDISIVLKENNNSVIGLYLKGLLLGQREHYAEAIKLLDAAIENGGSKQYPEIYLNRAKCHILLMNQKKAFSDLQQYVSYRIVEPDIHQYAAQFLFYIGAYDDAAKAYSNISDIKNNKLVLQKRYYCYVSGFNFQAGINDIDSLLILEDNKGLRFDKKVLELLLKSIQCVKREGERSQQVALEHEDAIKCLKQAETKFPELGVVFNEGEYRVMKGVFCFYTEKYQQAIENFEEANKIQSQSNRVSKKNNRHRSLNSYLHLNISICHMMMNNLAKAVGQLKAFREGMNDEGLKREISALMDVLKREMVESEKNKLKASKAIEFFPFSVENKLCSLYPKIRPPLVSKICTGLYFDVPEINQAPIKVEFDEKILDGIGLNWIQMRPEAEWLPVNTEAELGDQEEERIEEMKGESRSGSEDNYGQEYQYEEEEESGEDEKEERGKYQQLSKSKFRTNLQHEIKHEDQSPRDSDRHEITFGGPIYKEQNNKFKLKFFKEKQKQKQQTRQKHSGAKQEQRYKQFQLQREMEYRQYQHQKARQKQRLLHREEPEEDEEEEEQEPLPFNPKKWAEDMKLGKEFEEKFKRVVGKTEEAKR